MLTSNRSFGFKKRSDLQMGHLSVGVECSLIRPELSWMWSRDGPAVAAPARRDILRVLVRNLEAFKLLSQESKAVVDVVGSK